MSKERLQQEAVNIDTPPGEPNTRGKRPITVENVVVGVLVVAIGLVLTLVFMLGGIIVSDQANKQATYQSLRDQVQSQNAKIDALTNALNATKTPLPSPVK